MNVDDFIYTFFDWVNHRGDIVQVGRKQIKYLLVLVGFEGGLVDHLILLI